MTSDVGSPPDVSVTVSAAEQIFGDNLLFAFVGGSYARGDASSSSDVDVFVLLDHPHRESEVRFARWLRDYHEKNSLKFSHCGEVVSRSTLDTLLDVAETIQDAAPPIAQSACYHADCELSSFRKGDVMYKFLADVKIEVVGDLHLLRDYEARSVDYFARHSYPRVQEQKGRLDIRSDSQRGALLRTLDNRRLGADWVLTPVGISLDDWFAERPKPRIAHARLPTLHRAMCPQDSLSRDSALFGWADYQCIATESRERCP